MDLITLKAIFALSIFILSLISGLASLKINRATSAIASISDAASSGVFLGAALLHMLPDAVAKFEELHSCHYPVAHLICLVTFMLLLLMERGLFTYGNSQRANKKNTMPLFLVGLLAIHSLIEGAAIGVNDNLLEILAIFIAVFTHKGSESFALATNLARLAVDKKNIKKAIAIFSMVTPLGILIASYVLYLTTTTSGGTAVAIFNAIAAGTFLYLSTEHLIEGKKSFESLYEVIALIVGVSVMAMVAVFV